MKPLALVCMVLIASCKSESRLEAARRAQAIRERARDAEYKANPKAWNAKRRKVERAARTPPNFAYEGDSLAVRKVSAKHRALIAGTIPHYGIRQADGSCALDSRNQVRPNPRFGLFAEIATINFRTCVIQLWVIDPHLPESGMMSSDTTVRVAPR